MCNNQKGFTLIELLVVVLIIGILAAVALPQYQKAVEKARVTEAKTLLKTIVNAQDVYALEHNNYGTHKLEDLSITIPGEYEEDGTLLITKNWEIFVDECLPTKYNVFGCNIFAMKNNGNYGVRTGGTGYDDNYYHGQFECYTSDGTEDTVCPKVGAHKEGYMWLF